MDGAEKQADYRKKKAFKALRKDLIEKLALRGLDQTVYIDKVNEYMDLWVMWCKLRDDVDARGLTVMDERGRLSENRSVSLAFQASRQMLAIIYALGMQAAEDGSPDDEL